MSFIQRIAAFLETTLTTNRPQTSDDFALLARSLRENDLPATQEALDAVEAEFDAKYFELIADEMTLKRAEKKRNDARAQVARVQEAIQRAEKQAQWLGLQAHREVQLQRAQETDELLARRVDAAAVIDECIVRMSEALLELRRLNAAVLEHAPTRLRHWPDLLMPATIQPIIEQKLYGFTNGNWKGVVGMETPFTARKLRTLKARAIEERAHIMSQQPTNEPPSAA